MKKFIYLILLTSFCSPPFSPKANAQQIFTFTTYISHWSFWKREIPTSFQGNEYFSTINVLASLTQLVKGGYTDELAKKALNMSLAEGYFKMHSLRVCDANFLAKMADGVY